MSLRSHVNIPKSLTVDRPVNIKSVPVCLACNKDRFHGSLSASPNPHLLSPEYDLSYAPTQHPHPPIPGSPQHIRPDPLPHMQRTWSSALPARDMASSSASKSRPARSPEPFEHLAGREEAAQILQSYENLSWYAAQRRESIPQTRLHFQSVIAGFTASDAQPYIQWRTDTTPHVPDPPDSDPTVARVKTSQSGGSRGAGKGKERVSGEDVAGPSGTQSPAGKGRDRSTGAAGTGTSAKKKRKSEGGGGRR